MRESLEFRILGAICAIVVLGIVAAAALVLRFQSSVASALASERLEGTAQVVVSGLEQTMLDADETVTRDFVDSLKALESFEAVELFDAEGRSAFESDAPIVELEALRRLHVSREPFSVEDGDHLTFYMPLANESDCQSCHDDGDTLRGAVKITMSLEKESQKKAQFVSSVVVGTFVMIGLLLALLRSVIRSMVIGPIRNLDRHAVKMANGDLSFRAQTRTADEIGRLGSSIKASLSSLSDILRKSQEVAGRIAETSEVIERDADEVVRGTEIEGQAVAQISTSVGQLNSVIGGISESTETLAVSAEQSAASVQELAAGIASITEVACQLRAGVEEAVVSIAAMSSGTNQIASNARELVAVSESTLSAVEQIIASVNEVGTNAKMSSSLSRKVAEEASTLGATAINRATEGMQRIQVSVEKTSQAVHRFASRFESIGSIVGVIDDITGETKLLALNAAILAARAGEHGGGFSIVADQIQQLSERTETSTREISQLVQSLRQEASGTVEAMAEGLRSVEEGLGLSRDASSALEVIIAGSDQSMEMTAAIESATEDQCDAARSVTGAMERMRRMVGQIASAALEQERAAASIGQMADRTRDASQQVETTATQQAEASRQISEAAQVVSEMTQEISRAIREQRAGAEQIWSSLERIKDVPRENRDISARIKDMLQGLLQDSGLVSAELRRITLYERDGSNMDSGMPASRQSAAASTSDAGPASRPFAIPDRAEGAPGRLVGRSARRE